jgi:hypothetical protein
VSVSNDETANALGNGPYQETSTTTSTYLTPRDNFAYPLQTGATMTIPQSDSQSTTFADVNASGTAPSNGTNVGTRLPEPRMTTGHIQVFTGATSSTTTTVALPSVVNGVNTIPVTTTAAGLG